MRLTFAIVGLASLATACTAIVFGQVGDKPDYAVKDNIQSSLDECSLQKGLYGDVDANACSTCIETSCKSDITYACNGGGTAKPWFSDMKSCAQSPWVYGFAPQDVASSQYGCRDYKTAKTPISDNGSDTEREITAHNCITNNCLTGDRPACKQCDVHIKKSDDDPVEAELQDDDCGKCLYQNCQTELIRCCDVSDTLMNNFVRKCAFTKDEDNLKTCYELRKNDPDGGKPDGGPYTPSLFNSSYPEEVQCFVDITTCFKNNCAGLSACKPPGQ